MNGGTPPRKVVALAAETGTEMEGFPSWGMNITEIAVFAGSKPVPLMVKESSRFACEIPRDVMLTGNLLTELNATVTA